VGWLGGNILKSFQLTIDFSNRMTYWQQEADLDPNDLNQVGLSLLALGNNYLVAGFASKDGKPSVAGIEPGDRLLQVGPTEISGASRDTVLLALHGHPDETRALVLDRDGVRFAFRGERDGILSPHHSELSTGLDWCRSAHSFGPRLGSELIRRFDHLLCSAKGPPSLAPRVEPTQTIV
jgi:hypothetical protein